MRLHREIGRVLVAVALALVASALLAGVAGAQTDELDESYVGPTSIVTTPDTKVDPKDPGDPADPGQAEVAGVQVSRQTLPVTGGDVLGLVGMGAVVIAAGAGLLWARRALPAE